MRFLSVTDHKTRKVGELVLFLFDVKYRLGKKDNPGFIPHFKYPEKLQPDQGPWKIATICGFAQSSNMPFYPQCHPVERLNHTHLCDVLCDVSVKDFYLEEKTSCETKDRTEETRTRTKQTHLNDLTFPLHHLHSNFHLVALEL